MSIRDRLQRRVIPRLVVALSTVRWPGRVRAAVRRALSGRARVRVYVAFDDPYSAVALLGLVERLGRRRVRLDVEPVVARGITGDPAVADKRRYAVVDARRLARRAGRELSRGGPVPADETAFLAAWATAAPQGKKRIAFCAAALAHIWHSSDGPVLREPYAEFWKTHVGGEPPQDGAASVAHAERRMRRRGLYDTPIAVVHGEWFFAHERLAQIEHRLDDLGWVAS
jgi:2-hydroxychromene-2-carboxylate isomerase